MNIEECYFPLCEICFHADEHEIFVILVIIKENLIYELNYITKQAEI